MAREPRQPERRRPDQRTSQRHRPAAPTSWDALATWYDGWVGEGGSEYHREVALPALLRLLAPQPRERVLDIGAGQGVPAPAIARAGARYVGVDASPRLIAIAKKRHGRDGKFLVGDARKLTSMQQLEVGGFDAVTFLLSLQDMDPLEPVLSEATAMLKPGGRAVLVLTHPSFRVPRQSGWGWDEGRKLLYRRVDRYLTPLPVPMKPFPGGSGVTRSFHRPISAYVNGLSAYGLLIDRLDEIPAHRMAADEGSPRAVNLARKEIPLFLGLRGRKLE